MPSLWQIVKAKTGNVQAAYELAKAYADKDDDKNADKWAEIAFEKTKVLFATYKKQIAGNSNQPLTAEQAYELGLAHSKKDSLQDKLSAFLLFLLSAERDVTEAQYSLANMLLAFDLAIDAIDEAVYSSDFLDSDFGCAVICLVALYEELEDCVDFDNLEVAAVLWYTKAAENGHINAQYELAEYYLNKLRDYNQALRWY